MENSQKVRHIPIFVEGRDEPIINKDHNTSQNSNSSTASANASAQNSGNSAYASASAESSSGPYQHQPSHQNPYFENQNHTFGHRPQMNFDDMDGMGFGDMQMPGSIFERAKDFPVRTDFPNFFSNVRSASPRRSESPIHVQHQQQNQPKKSSSGNAPPAAHNLKQSGSSERPIPVQHENVKRASTPQRQQTPPRQQPPQQSQPQQQQQVPTQQQQQPQTEEQNSTSAKQKAIEDSITKIQKIQQSVLELMGRVEKYDGSDRKEYLFLDEMLTQNLLKLDNIDAEGKDNIKNARREAIKCINSLISLLEAKNDEATSSNTNGTNSNNNNSNNDQSQTTEASGNKNVDQSQQPTQELNGTSKNSSYDNINQVQGTSSTNSVNMTDVPEKSAEASLEQKIAEAISKQDGQDAGQKQT